MFVKFTLLFLVFVARIITIVLRYPIKGPKNKSGKSNHFRYPSMADTHHFSSFKLAGYQPFATHTFSAPQLRGHHLKEMTREFVGPMPHRDFLEEFMPIKPGCKSCPAVRKTLFLPVVPQPLERDMYDLFVSIH